MSFLLLLFLLLFLRNCFAWCMTKWPVLPTNNKIKQFKYFHALAISIVERGREWEKKQVSFIACSFWSIRRKLFSFGFYLLEQYLICVCLCVAMFEIPTTALNGCWCRCRRRCCCWLWNVCFFLLVLGSSDLQMLVALDQIRIPNKWKNVWWCYAYGAIEAITMHWSKFEPIHLVPFSLLFPVLGVFFVAVNNCWRTPRKTEQTSLTKLRRWKEIL